MALTNSANSFGAVSKTFHWLTALLILSLMPLGLIANEMPYDTSEELTRKAWMFSLHKTLGVAVFFVALARIGWALSQPKPGPMHPDRKAESLAAETVHWLLYGSLVAVPLTGWIHHAATTGFAPIWWPFGQTLPMVPKSEAVAATFAGAHWVLTKVLGLALLLHIAGALKHHVIDRDATLRRMWFGQTNLPATPAKHAHGAPIVAALALWALALTGGAALGVYAPHGGPATGPALAAVQSDWQVEDGALTLTVTQLGSEVTGSFADWTAAIRFDETVTQGVAGDVEVMVAIGSLTLGAVTAQAMGPDYFDASAFPTAIFAADILAAPEGYTAQGTLTIKDRSVPVTLPFTLVLDAGTAEMTGALSLDRRAFGIGDNMTDEGSLKFNVDVQVSLTARQAAAN
ncbi:cytochrome b/b6 domain-containing protein [uncultured Tateyamaria sp.]|uniref:cytochrome b/b6 domain-containing protein n=1 Tax=uncultured Tateyamaria sp. TaxID=455651 RepID=UPI00260DFD75|nr:cytochrome b/b6 domain-containing protein [uncultured Tateyamaria sp.]